MSSGNIVLGQTVVTKDNYEAYIQAIRDEANAHQDVSQSDLAPLEQFLGMSGNAAGDSAAMQSAASTLGISNDQLLSLQNDVASLDDIVQMGSSQGYLGGSSAHGTSNTNKMWTDSIDQLLSGASAQSQGIGTSANGQSAGGISVSGQVNSGTAPASAGSVTYPSNTPLAQFASSSGAKVTYNADNNLFTVSNSTGVELFSGAGQELGNVPAGGLKVAITNPANPSLGYVSIDGSGQMTNSSGSAGQFADLTIQGTGGGQYTTGNTLGVGGSSAGTVSLPPGSDAAQFAQSDATNLSDPSAVKVSEAGSIAIKGKDNQWHVFDGSGHAVGKTPTSSGSINIPAVSSAASGASNISAFGADTFTVTNGSPSFSSESGLSAEASTSAEAAAISSMSAPGVTNGKQQKTADGRTIVYETVDNKSQFAIFNADGSQQVPKEGWQVIDPSQDGGRGTVDLGNGQFLNFDTTSFTIDSKNNNPGTPLTLAQLAVQGTSGVDTSNPAAVVAGAPPSSALAIASKDPSFASAVPVSAGPGLIAYMVPGNNSVKPPTNPRVAVFDASTGASLLNNGQAGVAGYGQDITSDKGSLVLPNNYTINFDNKLARNMPGYQTGNMSVDAPNQDGSPHLNNDGTPLAIGDNGVAGVGTYGAAYNNGTYQHAPTNTQSAESSGPSNKSDFLAAHPEAQLLPTPPGADSKGVSVYLLPSLDGSGPYIAAFNQDGSAIISSGDGSSGGVTWAYKADKNLDSGKGSVVLPNNMTVNFDCDPTVGKTGQTGNATLDPSGANGEPDVKNPGTPFGVQANGVVGIGTFGPGYTKNATTTGSTATPSGSAMSRFKAWAKAHAGEIGGTLAGIIAGLALSWIPVVGEMVEGVADEELVELAGEAGISEEELGAEGTEAATSAQQGAKDDAAGTNKGSQQEDGVEGAGDTEGLSGNDLQSIQADSKPLNDSISGFTNKGLSTSDRLTALDGLDVGKVDELTSTMSQTPTDVAKQASQLKAFAEAKEALFGDQADNWTAQQLASACKKIQLLVHPDKVGALPGCTAQEQTAAEALSRMASQVLSLAGQL